MKLTSISHIAAALAVIASSAIASPHPIDHDLTHQQHSPPAPHPIHHGLTHQQHTLPAHEQPPPPQQRQQSDQRDRVRRQLVHDSYRQTAKVTEDAVKLNKLAVEDAGYAKNYLKIHGYVSRQLGSKEKSHVRRVKKFSERLGAYQQAQPLEPGGKTMSPKQRHDHRKQAERSIELAEETSDRAWATLEGITPGISKHSTLGRYAYAGHGIPPPKQREGVAGQKKYVSS